MHGSRLTIPWTILTLQLMKCAGSGPHENPQPKNFISFLAIFSDL
jgi:hypothetical protein